MRAGGTGDPVAASNRSYKKLLMEIFIVNLTAFFSWLVTTSWQASVLVLLVLLIQWIFGRWLTARWRYALWFLVLGRLMLPALPSSGLSVFNLIEREPVREAAVFCSDAMDAAYTGSYDLGDGFASRQTSEQSVSVLPATGLTPSHFLYWKTWLALSWLLGFLLLLARTMVTHGRMCVRVSKSSLVSETRIIDLLESCKQTMGVKIRLRVRETELVTGPCLLGVFRPQLLLPPGMMQTFNEREMRFIFLHELAHIRRRDPSVNWVLSLLQYLHWLNPVIWLGLERMKMDREPACDAMVLSRAGENEHQGYGETILHLLERVQSPRSFPGMVGIVEDEKQMTRRITLISQFRRTSVWLSALGIALIVVLSIVGLTRRDSSPTISEERSFPEPKPLVMAARRGQTDKVRKLLQEGADPEMGIAALREAAKNGHLDTVNALLDQGININAKDSGGMTALHYAAMNDYPSVVKILISKGADVNLKLNGGATALHLAAGRGNVEIVEYLLSHGAEVNTKDDSGRTPLQQAAVGGTREICSTLITHGAVYDDVFTAAALNDTNKVEALLEKDSKLVSTKGAYDETPLHWAAMGGGLDTAALLLSRGAEVDARARSREMSPLCMAAMHGHPEVAQLLLDKGADPQFKSVLGYTPLFWAVTSRKQGAAELLILHAAHVAPESAEGQMILHRTAEAGKKDLVRLMISNGWNYDIFCAAALGDVDQATLLLKKNPELLRATCALGVFSSSDARTRNLETPLHWAVSCNQKEMVKFLLDRGADPNARGYFGCTPLHYARTREMVELLLQRKWLVRRVNINAADDDGRTPLHWAKEGYNSDPEVVELLTKAGGVDYGEPTPAPPPSKTELLNADLINLAGSGATNQVLNLIAQGGDLNARGDQGRTLLMIAVNKRQAGMARFLIGKGADVNAKDSNGMTALQLMFDSDWGESDDSLEVIKALIAKNADLNETDSKHGNPLQNAAFFGLSQAEQSLVTAGARPPQTLIYAAAKGDLGSMEKLLAEKKDVNEKDSRGRTPLIAASRNGHLEAVNLLLSHGADVNAQAEEAHRNWLVKTALATAIQARHMDVASALIAKGADLELKNPNGETLLFNAVLYNQTDVVECLLICGANADAKGPKGRTAKEIGLRSGNSEIVEMFKRGVRPGSKPRYQPGTKAVFSSNPLARKLYEAASKGDLNEVRALLTQGVDVNAGYQGGGTALYAAVIYNKKDVVEFLISKGANVNFQGNLRMALRYGHMDAAKVLLAHGATEDIFSASALNDTARLKDFLDEYKDAVDVQDGAGWTPLYWALWLGAKDSCQLLLHRGANVNAREKIEGATPLIMGVRSLGAQFIPALLDKGADINAPDNYGMAMLHWSSFIGDSATVQVLLSRKADFNLKTKKNETALQLAKEKKHPEIVELLKKAGAKE